MSSPSFKLPVGEESSNRAMRLELETAMQSVIDSFYEEIGGIVTGLLPVGHFDATQGRFPEDALHGSFYFVTAPGTVDGEVFAIGDWLVPLIDGASTTTFKGNWTRGDYSKVVNRVYEDVQSLAASREEARGNGALWLTADGQRFVEDSTATLGFIENKASTPVRMRVVDLFDIDARAFAPATGGADASAGLQAALDLFKARLEAGIPCRLRIIGEYTVEKPLVLNCTEDITAQGVIDMSGGEIKSALSSGSLFRISSRAVVRNLNLNYFRLQGAGSDVDTLLELDGGSGRNRQYLYRCTLMHPELTGGKVPLWIRNNAFEMVIVHPQTSPTISGENSQAGRYSMLFDDDFDAPTPDGKDEGTVAGGNVSSITVLGGTVRGGQHAVFERSPADVRFYGTTFLESWNELYRGPKIGTQNGGVFGCHFENAWVIEDWSQWTAYPVGALVQSGRDGNVYLCSRAGLSGAANGPSGTGTGIVDGTALWDYVDPRPVVRMDNCLLVHDSDYRQNKGYANYLLSSFMVGRNQAPEWLATSRGEVTDFRYLHLRNTSDNGARLFASARYRGNIGFADTAAGPNLVSIANGSNHQTFGKTSGELRLAMQDGPSYFVEAEGDIVFSAPPDGHPGDRLAIHLLQDEIGGHAIAFSEDFHVAGLSPDITPGARTAWSFYFTGSSWLPESFLTGAS